MNKNKSVLIGLSGGVDSSVAALKLKKAGYDVQGIHFLLWKNNEKMEFEEIEKERIDSICKKIDIPIIHLDVKKKFHQTIIVDLKEKLNMGLTPNPCVRCNPLIKFRMLFDVATEMGIEKIATGHYVAIRRKANHKLAIFIPKDIEKDQTYFLCYLNQNFLEKAIFPLGDSLKKDIYSFADENGLKFFHDRESQDLCFLGEEKYDVFLSEISQELTKPGEIVNSHGDILGQHEGLAYFTIGQRKGIRVAAEEPYFVIRKEIQKNQLVVGHKEEIGFKSIKIKDANWIGGVDPKINIVDVKIRYQAKLVSCELKKLDERIFTAYFEDIIRDPAPGQYAVFYKDSELLGGGEIFEAV